MGLPAGPSVAVIHLLTNILLAFGQSDELDITQQCSSTNPHTAQPDPVVDVEIVDIAYLQQQVSVLQERLLVLEGKLSTAPYNVPREAVTAAQRHATQLTDDMVNLHPNNIELIYRHRLTWAKAFKLDAAWRLSSGVSSFHFARKLYSNAIKFLVIGDGNGWLQIASMGGNLLWQQDTGCGGPITSLSSYELASGRQAVLVASTVDGRVYSFNVTHTPPKFADGTRGDYVISHVERIYEWSTQKTPGMAPAVMSVASRSGQNRYITAVVRESEHDSIATWHANGSMRAVAHTPSRVLMINPAGTQSVAITHNASLHFNPANREQPLRVYECRGLNGSTLSSVCVNPLRRTQAYGVTTHGALLLLGFKNQRTLSECKVKSTLDGVQIVGAASVACMSGYLIIASQGSGLTLYNMTGKPTATFNQALMHSRLEDALEQVWSKLPSTVSSQPLSVQGMEVSDHLLAVSFSNGVFALFTTHLPLLDPLGTNKQKPWLGQPIFILIVAGGAIWYATVYSKRRAGGVGGRELPPDLQARRERLMALTEMASMERRRPSRMTRAQPGLE